MYWLKCNYLLTPMQSVVSSSRCVWKYCSLSMSVLHFESVCSSIKSATGLNVHAVHPIELLQWPQFERLKVLRKKKKRIKWKDCEDRHWGICGETALKEWGQRGGELLHRVQAKTSLSLRRQTTEAKPILSSDAQIKPKLLCHDICHNYSLVSGYSNISVLVLRSG